MIKMKKIMEACHGQGKGESLCYKKGRKDWS